MMTRSRFLPLSTYLYCLGGQTVAGFSVQAFPSLSQRGNSFSPLKLSHRYATPSQNSLILANDAYASVQASLEESDASTWAKHALLISSFTNGIMDSSRAQSFLKYGLARALLEERVRIAENAVRESVLFSPCNGPNMDALHSLEAYDQQLSFLSNDNDNNNNDAAANQWFQSLDSTTTHTTTSIRLVYIPTALYALNPKSCNTPGRQRQRARADARKRRSQIVQHVMELVQPHLSNVNVLAITLDLDDGSVKQPVGSNVVSDFPKNGEVALTDWAPHIVYVEGGNTFWLHHCATKGNWQGPLRRACTGPDATSLYIGKSAGAILAGASVETATWKGWDDPSVVPNHHSGETGPSEDRQGLAMVGSRSFFPHMSDDWEMLVAEKRAEMNDQDAAGVVCLGEWDACCVDGYAQKIILVTGENDQ